MALTEEQIIGAIKRAVEDCVDGMDIASAQLTDQRLESIATGIEGVNQRLDLMNGTVRENAISEAVNAQWRLDHAREHEKLEQKVDSGIGEGRIIGALQVLWAPVAAYLLSLFKGGGP